MPAWAVWVLKALLANPREFFKWLGIALLAVLAIVMLPLLIPMAIIFGSIAPAGSAAPGLPAGILGFWPDPVRQQDSYGIPVLAALSVMAHESGGAWLAENLNRDGSTDAGLMQINSRNWPRYGLQRNPYAPQGNIAAGLSILNAAARGCGGSLPCALEAYNGGGPGYAAAVLGQAARIEAGPHLYVWALGDMGNGRAVAIPGPGRVTFLVTAYAPWGYPPQPWLGRSWPGIEGPQSLAASTQGSGQAVALQPCTSAPAGIAHLLPPGAGCLYATLAAGPGQVAGITITATFLRMVTVTGPHGHSHLRQEAVPVTASAAAGPSASVALDLAGASGGP
jgi:hypothetical protein